MNRILARVACITLLAALCLQMGAAAAVGQEKPDEVLRVMAGKSVVYAVDFKIAKVATGDPEIFGVVQTGDNEMLINAKKEGASNLIIWGEADQRVELFINVLTPDLMLQAEELRGLLEEIEGVEVKIVGKRVVVEGLLFRTKDYNKINQLLASMPEVVNLVQMSPYMKKILAAEIERAIGRANIFVRVAKDAFLLEGVVPNEEESARAEKVALAYTPAVVNALVSSTSQERPKPYDRPKLIEVNLTVMEIARSALKEFGIYWNPTIQTQADGSVTHTSQINLWPLDASRDTQLYGALTGTITSFFPTMQRINQQGTGRNLMQQTIVTKDGAKAEFFAGTERPIAVAQEGGTVTIEYKKVGMTLNVIPNIDPLSNINTLLEIESSTVTGESNGAPILRKHTMVTDVNVDEGVTIVLGGLAGQDDLRSLDNSNPDGVPSLFQANYGTGRERNDTEVVIFITPKVVTDVKMANKEVKMNANREFRKIELDNLRRVYVEKYN